MKMRSVASGIFDGSYHTAADSRSPPMQPISTADILLGQGVAGACGWGFFFVAVYYNQSFLKWATISSRRQPG